MFDGLPPALCVEQAECRIQALEACDRPLQCLCKAGTTHKLELSQCLLMAGMGRETFCRRHSYLVDHKQET